MWAMELSSNVPLNRTDGSNILAPKIIISQQVYYWQGTPPTEKWICAGDAFLMFDLDVPPEITSYAPKLPVNDTECATRTFNITMFHSNSSLGDCFARGYSGFT